MPVTKIFTNKLMVAVFAIICCLLWGSAFPAVKIGYRLFEIPVDNTWLKIIFAGYRFFLASIFILVYALVSRQSFSVKWRDIKHVILIGIIGTALSYLFFYLGLSHTSGVKASVLNSTMTFFTVVIAHFFLTGDKINKNKAFGLVMGFGGVIAANFSFELLRPDFTINGDGFLIISQLMGAISTVYVKKVSGSVPIIVLTGYQMLIGSLMLIVPASFKVGVFPFHFNPANLSLYLYLALLSAIAFSLWNTVIKYNTVGKVAIYQFLIPIFGAILSAAFLKGETITIATFVALAMVSFGIVSVNISGAGKEIAGVNLQRKNTSES